MRKATYIKFKAPKPGHQSQTDGIIKQTFKKAVNGILTSLIPKANPDFDHRINLIENWLIEFDSESGIPEREIGLDKNELPILKMPYKNNYGYWTDNNLVLKDFQEHFSSFEISGEDFEKYWKLFDRSADEKNEIF
ncbi:hypothetical protein [Salegentibacter salarius]|uniref:Uncharacterized protein n=1 Tax=Salegentibacter salarius TaxID=435906 RepID=A0A2N0TQE8_9FLAO|nr:hypothetical protein [Salegentibacter salarius]OEY71727.1 hypothetical protein BHS39_15050 [Salegentibacter salarius]PKD16963.1 hypothetical protein APR40_15020 [Salegentibacter salarius]SLJ89770.1 hypothetical protein SAMN05660445_00866 [Salegentibacter salarius]